MADAADALARKTAATLAVRFGAELPLEVEKQIHRREAGEPPERYVGVAESVAIATLILQCAQVAWQVYKDTRDKGAIKRKLRLEVRLPGRITAAQRDQVIEAVVEQLDGGLTPWPRPA